MKYIIYILLVLAVFKYIGDRTESTGVPIDTGCVPTNRYC